MDVNALIAFIEQYGYAALFFSLWLGIFGLPVPDEVIVMTGGLVASLHMLNVIPAFLVLYVGVVSGLTLGFLLGRFIGEPILTRLRTKKNMGNYLEKSRKLAERYGAYSLLISYFFPVVRHLVPYIAGIAGMSLRKYALYSYTIGFLWTLLFFGLGLFFGNHIQQIGKAFHTYGLFLLLAFLTISTIIWTFLRVRRINT